MSYTFILEKNSVALKGYINEFPNDIIESTCIVSLKQKLRTKLTTLLGNKMHKARIKTVIKFI